MFFSFCAANKKRTKSHAFGGPRIINTIVAGKKLVAKNHPGAALLADGGLV